MSAMEWTPDMGEISGFGGSYEAGCRAMLDAGIAFAAEQDAAHARGERSAFDPEFSGLRGVYGLIYDDNEDAKALTRALMSAAFTDPATGSVTTVREYGATGAMHQAVVSHVLAFRRLGAAEYCRQLRERERSEARG